MKKAAISLMMFLCTACSWYSPSSKFYVMESENLEAVSTQKKSISVAKVNVPDLLNRQQIVVYDKKSNEVQILEFERWAEFFPDMVQATVVNDLMAYLPNSYVTRTYFGTKNSDFNVNIEINDIKAYVGDKVVLSAWWNIYDSKGNLRTKEQKIYESAVLGKKMQNLVDAQADAVHKLSADIAEKIGNIK